MWSYSIIPFRLTYLPVTCNLPQQEIGLVVVATGSIKINHCIRVNFGIVQRILTGRGADHPPPSKPRGQERVGLYLYSPSGPQWPVIGRPSTFTKHPHAKRNYLLTC